MSAGINGPDGQPRCFWCGGHDDYIAYHDDEWGMPVADDTRLYEKLCLEGFQSGLSWLTILRKRDNFRAAFDGFDFEKVARYTDKDASWRRRRAASPPICGATRPRPRTGPPAWTGRR